MSKTVFDATKIWSRVIAGIVTNTIPEKNRRDPDIRETVIRYKDYERTETRSNATTQHHNQVTKPPRHLCAASDTIQNTLLHKI
jgi:hypothetical protein